MHNNLLVCRTCGARASLDLAVNEQELANVGMLERHCGPCSRQTTWGLLEDYRKRERRENQRRTADRRRNHGSPATGAERRRGADRRVDQTRRTQRRAGR